MIDFELCQHGSIALLIPRSEVGRGWQDELLEIDALRWAGGTVVEPRYVPDILAGLAAEGLVVEVI